MMEYETIVVLTCIAFMATLLLLLVIDHIEKNETKNNFLSGGKVDFIERTTLDELREIKELLLDKDLLEQAQAKREAHKLYMETIKDLEELSK